MVDASMDSKQRIIDAFVEYGPWTENRTIEWADLVSVFSQLKPTWASEGMEQALRTKNILKDGVVSVEEFMDWVYTPAAGYVGDADMTADERDVEAAKIKEMQGKQRRAGVAAKSLCQDEVKDYQKPVYPKDEASIAHIQNTLNNNEKMNVLIGHVDKKSMDDLINAFYLQEALQDNFVIRQGEEGDCLYIIAEGNVDVYVARPGPDGALVQGDIGTKVVTFGPGVLFGELALLYAAPRAATVRVATSSAKFWALRSLDFKMLLAHNAQQTLHMYEGWLREVEILKTLNYYELSQLSELLDNRLYDAGEDIVVQGDPGQTFFILEDGTCSAFINGDAGEIEVKQYDKQGQYFGELALLNDEPRKATVRATGQGCAVVAIDREDFNNLVGALTADFRADAANYPKYNQFIQQ